MASGVAARRLDIVETQVHVSSPRFAKSDIANFRKTCDHKQDDREYENFCLTY
jgi:hypothetical protein